MPKSKMSNLLKGDQLAMVEYEIRSTGKWADITGLDKMSHYFVARNENSTLTISRCGTIVTTFDKIKEPLSGRRCLVCELFQLSKEEVDKANIQQLAHILNEAENKTQTTQEK